MISNYIKEVEDYLYQVSLSFAYPVIDNMSYLILALLLFTIYQLYKTICLLKEIIRVFTKKSNSIDSTFDDIYSELETISKHNETVEANLNKINLKLDNMKQPNEFKKTAENMSNIIVDAINSYKV